VFGALSNFRWISLVSRRHVAARKRRGANAASTLSIVGIAVGVAALITVLGVMNGFQLGTIETLVEVGSGHLRVVGPEVGELPEAEVAELSEVPGVAIVSRGGEIETLVRGFGASPRATVVREISPDLYEQDPAFAREVRVERGAFDVSERGSAVIGAELARGLGVGPGEEFQVVNLGRDPAGVREPQESRLTVSGTFRTGLYEYDSGWAFVSRETGSDALGLGAADQFLTVKLNDRFADARVALRVEEALGDRDVEVRRWRDFNRAIFAALRTEKTLLTVFLGLMFVVVAANIYQSQRRSVIERAEEIAILKALGATPRDIRALFASEGLVIGLSGAVIGTAVGLALALNVNEAFALVEGVVAWGAEFVAALGGPLVPGEVTVQPFSPQVFYIEEIPSTVLFREVTGIFLFAVGSAVTAATLAGRRGARMRPAEVLRDE